MSSRSRSMCVHTGEVQTGTDIGVDRRTRLRDPLQIQEHDIVSSSSLRQNSCRPSPRSGSDTPTHSRSDRVPNYKPTVCCQSRQDSLRRRRTCLSLLVLQCLVELVSLFPLLDPSPQGTLLSWDYHSCREECLTEKYFSTGSVLHWFVCRRGRTPPTVDPNKRTSTPSIRVLKCVPGVVFKSTPFLWNSELFPFLSDLTFFSGSNDSRERMKYDTKC